MNEAPACHAKPLSRKAHVTLVAIAALAFIAACVSHEAVGHGGMCVARGDRIMLLSSVYFRCSNGGPWTDLAGPLMNLVAGTACWVILRARRSFGVNWRLFLVLAMAFNLFWGAGQLVLCAITNNGDWAFALCDFALQPRSFWRCIMGIVGASIYLRSMRAVAAELPRDMPTLLAYPTGIAVACVAAACFTGGSFLPALREGAIEGFGTGLGLLLLDRRRLRRAPAHANEIAAIPSTAWIAVSATLTLLFFATLGRGLFFGGYVQVP